MLRKGFLKNRIEIFELSKLKLFIGIILGLFYAFFFYFFLKLIREFFRFFAATLHDYDLLILPEQATSFYNFFYAFIAVLFAQSIVMIYWFDKPKKYLSKYNYKRLSIINDHRVTNWYFLHWFAKIGYMFGLVAVDSYTFNIYPDYRYLFVLTAIVLYLQVWNNFRNTLKNKSLKWMLYSLIIILTVSFGLSKIDIIDYQKMNESLLNNNISYKYDINPPISKVYEKLEHKNLVIDIYVADNSIDSIPVLILNREIVNQKKLRHVLYKLQELLLTEELPYAIYRLHINREIKMKYVTELKNKLYTYGAVKNSYAIRPFGANQNIPIYHEFYSSFPTHKIHTNLNEVLRENQIEIRFLENGDYLYNNSVINYKELKILLKESIKYNPEYSLKIYINNWISFDDYFKVISTLGESIYELRNEYSKKEFSKDYDQLKQTYRYNEKSLSEFKQIKNKYIINIIDEIEMN